MKDNNQYDIKLRGRTCRYRDFAGFYSNHSRLN